MLDQNTDRMWYVIGAVIIGAAIIFILNGTMPELFASVGETFEDKADDVSATVNGMENYYGDGINLLKDSDTFGKEFPTISYDENAYHYNTDGGSGRTSKLKNPSNVSYAFAFKYPSATLPDANAYIHDVFVEPDTYYTFSFIQDRLGYSPVSYSIYFGETLVGSFIGQAAEERVSFSAKSPTNLEGENYIKIRSNHTSNITANAFWMTHPKLETGRIATPYSK